MTFLTTIFRSIFSKPTRPGSTNVNWAPRGPNVTEADLERSFGIC